MIHKAWLRDADKAFATELYAFALLHLDRIELDNIYWSRVRFYVREIDVAGRNAFLHEVARVWLGLGRVAGEPAEVMARGGLNLVHLIDEYPNAAALRTHEMLATAASGPVGQAARAALERLSTHSGPHGERLRDQAAAALLRLRRPGPLARCAAWLGRAPNRASAPPASPGTLYN